MIDIFSFDAVLFDMDGVVLDSEKAWERADYSADELFKTGFDKTVRFECCGRDERSVRAFLKSLKPDLDVDAYREYIIECVRRDEEANGAPIKDGFIELITRLKNANIKTALATSSRRDRAEKLFKRAGLNINELFDAVATREDVTVAKPNPEIFLTVAKRLNVSPENAIVLEDSPNGLAAAYAGGFTPIMVIDLIPPPEEYVSKGLTVINSLKEFI